jgi:3-hydroxyacyl-[acyl-carrier-protein] dehydratase
MEEKLSYSIEEIKAVLPHRYPFLLIDRVTEVVGGPTSLKESRVGRRATAVKCVTFNEPFFQGHFPTEAIMPGVLLVEAMAQTGAFACFRGNDKPVRVVIAKIMGSRFRKPVIPGDQVILSGEVKKDKGRLVVLECTAKVNDQLVAECEFMAHVTLQSQVQNGESQY